MTALGIGARHAATLRQPWQVRRRGRGVWGWPVALLVLAMPLLLSALWLDLAVRTLVVSTGLIALTGLWWLQAEGLINQNRHPLARLVPTHARTLRLQMLLQGLLVTAAAVALVALVVPRPLFVLWLVLPAVVTIAWVIREPLLWLAFAAGSPFLGGMRSVAEHAAALPWGLQAAAVMLMGLLLSRSVGSGGRLHRWADARQQRWRQHAQALQEGRAAPRGAAGGIGRALQRAAEWPQRHWRGRVLAAGAQAPLVARLELGLGTGGSWALMGCIGLVLAVGLVVVVAAVVMTTGTPLAQVVDAGRYGFSIGLYSLIAGPLNSRLVQLWSRRREQALLVLLPGMPAGGDAALLERQWRRQALIAWALVTAALLALSTLGSPGAPQFVAACGAMCLPLLLLVQAQQRRLRGRVQVAVAALWPLLAAPLAAVAQWQGVPALASLLAGVVAYALLARVLPARPLRLPVGRAG